MLSPRTAASTRALYAAGEPSSPAKRALAFPGIDHEIDDGDDDDADAVDADVDWQRGLVFEYARGEFERLPPASFWHAPRDARGIAESARIDAHTEADVLDVGGTLASALDQGNFAVRFVGHLDVPARGGNALTFHLASNDGARLYIDGALAIDLDGVHYVQERSSRAIRPSAPRVALELHYFHRNGKSMEGLLKTGVHLELMVEVDGHRAAVTPDMLVHDPADPRIVADALLPDPPAFTAAPLPHQHDYLHQPSLILDLTDTHPEPSRSAAGDTDTLPSLPSRAPSAPLLLDPPPQRTRSLRAATSIHATTAQGRTFLLGGRHELAAATHQLGIVGAQLEAAEQRAEQLEATLCSLQDAHERQLGEVVTRAEFLEHELARIAQLPILGMTKNAAESSVVDRIEGEAATLRLLYFGALGLAIKLSMGSSGAFQDAWDACADAPISEWPRVLVQHLEGASIATTPKLSDEEMGPVTAAPRAE